MNERRALLKFIAASPLLALCPTVAEAVQTGGLEQAALALENGADGIIVSNHGGDRTRSNCR